MATAKKRSKSSKSGSNRRYTYVRNFKGRELSSVQLTELRPKVMLALSDPRWDYRTVTGISKQLHVSPAYVSKILNSSPEVRASVSRSTEGKKLYTHKSKTSLISDWWHAFRNMSSYKYGTPNDGD